MQYGIHWFRRDLRVAGNAALEWSWREHQGKVVGIFIFDSKFLARADFSHNRFGFFLNTLKVLKTELLEIGSDLLVLDESPSTGFEKLFEVLVENKLSLPSSISFNRDYEPFARERDQKLSKLFSEKYQLTVHTERDHLIFEPDEIKKNDGSFYQIYSPFAKKWFELFNQSQERIKRNNKALNYLQSSSSTQIFSLNWQTIFKGQELLPDELANYIENNTNKVNISLPPAGSKIALKRLLDFQKHSIEDYKEARDFPDKNSTSQLSIYLKNGSITSSIIAAALEYNAIEFKRSDGLTHFLREIVWREFYYHILYHRPDVEHGAFLTHYKNLPWQNNEQLFDAWKEGRTGYPLVDAGMRQLNTTGWMHNRVRMVVASFLTKDLLIDWRWGERYFMEKLLDGDLAPNNGGWQWAASTGCDPQPYFRIFNPYLQSKKFDPAGAYIRRYIPELKNVGDKFIHEPPASAGYYPPIVIHQQQKELALQMYRQR
jgi:deoxyribodipyrimidine photo-lyase